MDRYLKKFWGNHFQFNWKLGVFLILLFGIPRFYNRATILCGQKLRHCHVRIFKHVDCPVHSSYKVWSERHRA